MKKIKIDPRYFVIINHSFLITFGLFYTTLQRQPIQIIFCLFMTICAEVVFSFIDNKHLKRKWDDIIKSSIVISLGLLILLISRHWWFYGVAGLLAVLAKYLLRKDSDSHIYNPTGFAIIAMLTFFPNYLFVRGDQFNGSLIPIMSVVGWGSLAIIKADRWRLTVSYLLTALLISLIYCGLTPHRFLLLFGPDLGTAGLLFMFLMFTDPKTSPKDHNKQIFQGVVIAGLNLFFRIKQYAYPQFVALFLFSSFEAILFYGFERSKTSLLYYKDALFNLIQTKYFSYFSKVAILAVLLSPLIFSNMLFPFSDYRMFADNKKTEDLYVLIPAASINNEIKYITTNKSFLSYVFVLKIMFNTKNFESLNKTLEYFAAAYLSVNKDQKIDSLHLVKVRHAENVESLEKYPQEIVYNYDLKNKESK